MGINIMKKLKSKDNYVFVKKDKTEVYGNLMCTPDNFDESDLVEVTEAEAEEIRKKLEEEIMKQYEEA